ncbi:unnamed protein product [Protopolystoma xenopodis]|uniref:Uncharacterized protein n=1 Tax=Protopolystoma xenopodis TaxID=117903 RepID=A0A3S4ZHZ8_9PLAT|nr:unnamed protein product [Protopolystoma xenopodis]
MSVARRQEMPHMQIYLAWDDRVEMPGHVFAQLRPEKPHKLSCHLSPTALVPVGVPYFTQILLFVSDTHSPLHSSVPRKSCPPGSNSGWSNKSHFGPVCR